MPVMIEWWSRMSKAFTKESDAEGDEHDRAAEEAARAGSRESRTTSPERLQRLKDEQRLLLTRER
jgi:hypothetical protein